MKNSRVFLGFLIFALVSTSSAKKIDKSDSQLLKVSEHADYIESKPPEGMLSISGIQIGASTLLEAAKVFNGGDIHKTGDAGRSISRLCYVGRDGTVLSFESGEMGGTAGVITAARLVSAKRAYPNLKTCTTTDRITNKTSFSEGVGLVSTSQSARSKLGKPTKSVGDVLSYIYQVTDNSTGRRRDTLSMIEIKLVKRKVVEISVSHVEEYD